MKTRSLNTISEVEVNGKAVLVRVDLEWEGNDSPRERATLEIVKYLQEKGAARIKLIGHKGNISQAEELGVDVNWDLRADNREETDDESLAKELGIGFDVYVNEAFATSHRKHCSIDALPRWMKTQGKAVCVGLRFAKEIEVLTKVLAENGQKKILVIGGAKAGDKAKYADDLEKKFSEVLRGGLLDEAVLRADKLDINEEAIEKYKVAVGGAEMIVVAGPMGKYEDANAEKGTKEVFTAASESGAYKIAGGGDTEAALEKFGLAAKFDWISVGGGAMLEFLDKETLPGIEALS
jgi:phosphoglycerate kinase